MPVYFPVRILFANAEEVFQVETSYNAYELSGNFDFYGKAGPTAIQVQFPLDTTTQLPTCNHVDTISILGGVPVPITMVDAGMPTIFVSAASLLQLEIDLQRLMSSLHWRN
ncbi:hypothetical protein JB92DRAFT_3126733 [Gautieria morchelliformis]|nr:hypothetical protein JB92DRAFT_3126733 [Gautieria morchelliformis]